jgi:hydrogenase-4 component E
LSTQLINLFAATILLLAFAMLAQRRVLTLINLFALQGLTLALSTLVVAVTTRQTHLYWSAGLTLACSRPSCCRGSCTAWCAGWR